jgi:hypothetical protein
VVLEETTMVLGMLSTIVERPSMLLKGIFDTREATGGDGKVIGRTGCITYDGGMCATWGR